MNNGRDSPILPEEFEVVSGYTLEPIENVLHTAKTMVESAIAKSGATGFVAFLGEGASFREDKSTLQKYKNRTPEKPHYLDDVTEYLKKKFKPVVVSGLEADDWCVIEAYNKSDHFIIGEDKDYYSCPVRFFNVNKPDEGIVNCNGFGNLYRDTNSKGKPGKVRGKGRLHLYHQMLFGDDVDTYHAAYSSDIRGGSVWAYNRLKDCENDKEALIALVEGYKHLYPQPKIVTGWRGDSIYVDWKYVAQEMMDMARMLRWEGDEVNFVDVLEKLGVSHE